MPLLVLHLDLFSDHYLRERERRHPELIMFQFGGIMSGNDSPLHVCCLCSAHMSFKDTHIGLLLGLPFPDLLLIDLPDSLVTCYILV